MDRNKNSKGREKNVTSGSGNVYKRGEGLGGKKPVGNSGAYKERKEKTVSYNSNQSSSSQSNLATKRPQRPQAVIRRHPVDLISSA